SIALGHQVIDKARPSNSPRPMALALFHRGRREETGTGRVWFSRGRTTLQTVPGPRPSLAKCVPNAYPLAGKWYARADSNGRPFSPEANAIARQLTRFLAPHPSHVTDSQVQRSTIS